MGVSEVMKITSFMDSLKSPELAKRYSDKFPQIVEEIMVRLDDLSVPKKLSPVRSFPRAKLTSIFEDHSFLRSRGMIVHTGITTEGWIEEMTTEITPGEGTTMVCIEAKTIEHPTLPCEEIIKADSFQRLEKKQMIKEKPAENEGEKEIDVSMTNEIQMAKEDEEKTAFYTDQGTYCYTKMPFGLKNAGATYQSLFDLAFQSQIGINLEAYVDDMVIKSNDENVLLANIAKMFDNLRRINMKLNLNKCSFGMEEGKFLRYMVTSKDIRENPKKTRVFSNLQSPRTLKEMQSFSGKLAVLSLETYVDEIVIKSNDENILLANISEMFDNLRRINMKWNPNKCSFDVEEGKFLGYMVTFEDIRENPKKTRALANLQSPQTLKEIQSRGSFPINEKSYLDLPSLTMSFLKEALYAYLAISKETMSVVLVTDRKGKQCFIHYVSQTLNEAERNYSPIENLSLSLFHMTMRLRRYFEAHPVQVMTDQPIKQILDKQRHQGQVLDDFISETPNGEPIESYFRIPKVVTERDGTKTWTLFTDGASSLKRSRAGLVMISPIGAEYTYAFRITFASAINEAEYEALLAGLRIARRMKVQNLEANVDSKLVASQINKSYVPSSNNIIKYLDKEKEYIVCFKSFSIKNISKNRYQMADVLSKLASVAFNHLTKEILV
nr:hypothetical protein [Tanacetum cinerariifolium]